MMEGEKICCGKCLHFVAENEPCGKQPLGIPFPYTEFCSEFDKKCCGNCCWLCDEDVFGDGFCANNRFWKSVHCDDDFCGKYISKDKVRHSAAVLAQYKRNAHAPAYNFEKISKPKAAEIDEAIDVITRYVNVITKKV